VGKREEKRKKRVSPGINTSAAVPGQVSVENRKIKIVKCTATSTGERGKRKKKKKKEKKRKKRRGKKRNKEEKKRKEEQKKKIK